MINEGEMTAGNLLIVFFSILLGASQFGQVGPNMEAFSSARGAAYPIYRLIERQPEIDSLSEKGEKIKIEGDIRFMDCDFTYASRPDVQVWTSSA